MLPAPLTLWLIWSPYFLGASRATVNLRLSTRSRATFTVSGVAADMAFVMEAGRAKLPRPPITGKARGERPKIPHLA